MKLPSLPFLKKAEPKEYFLALLLQDEIVHAIVFEQIRGNVHTVGEGKSNFPAPIDDLSFEELLQASDKAISVAESTLPNGIQSHKTIFGVNEDWTENLQIRKDHLATLKKLCDELDLQPIGFLVFAEAIAHLLQKEEGAPISALLVELGTKHITATLMRAGRVVGSKQNAIADDLPKAVDSLFAEFSDVEILPSRIILVDNQQRPHLVQQFINHTWSKQLPFLHIPQITSLPDGFATQAILFGTATQMGFEMTDIPELPTSKGATDTPNSEIPETKEEQSKEIPAPIEDQEKETSLSEGENFGFVQDTDVLETAPKKPIVFDGIKNPDESSDELAQETFANIPEEVKEREERSGLPGIGANAVMLTQGMRRVFRMVKKIPFSSFLSHVKKNVPSPQDGTKISSKKLVFIAPLFLIGIIAIILWYIFGIRATATLFINPKIVNASQGITFSSSSTTDANSDTIGAQVSSIAESGSSSTQATGSQDVGDKAKGTVTIYNISNDSQSYAQGDTITSSNGLTFTLDQSVTVASGSSDPTNPSAGTAKVNVTASAIGTDYNLPSGTKFSIGTDTLVAAKNDTAFSGGTKKTVTVVAQKDLDKLTSDLTNSLGNKAKQDAQNNTGGKIILATFLSTTMSNQKLDHKLGDQASTINLSATITYQALAFTQADLDKVALAIIQANNPHENIPASSVSENIQKPTVSSDSKDINATLQIKAGLLPDVDTGKVADALAGKPFSQATTVLSDVPQLASVTGKLSPNLFFLPQSFPRISSHITITIKAHE